VPTLGVQGDESKKKLSLLPGREVGKVPRTSAVYERLDFRARGSKES